MPFPNDSKAGPLKGLKDAGVPPSTMAGLPPSAPPDDVGGIPPETMPDELAQPQPPMDLGGLPPPQFPDQGTPLAPAPQAPVDPILGLKHAIKALDVAGLAYQAAIVGAGGGTSGMI